MLAGRIDTHHHAVPTSYRRYLEANGIAASGGAPIPAWSPAEAIDVMDRFGIATGIMSVSAPGVHFGDDGKARIEARRANEELAEAVKDRPDRFGLFATLTLPDVDGAIAEAAYAFDELDADGVVLLANAHGTYLGDAAFEPLMAELDRRSALVFVHPTDLPGPGVPGIPPFTADFLLDTTRAAIKLAASGTTRRYPHIRFLLSHGGGFVPYAAYRLASAIVGPDVPDIRDALELLRDFYFDVALTSTPSALPSLLAFARPERMTYGSDWPFAPPAAVAAMARFYDRYPLDDVTRSNIDRTNAEALFPRLRG